MSKPRVRIGRREGHPSPTRRLSGTARIALLTVGLAAAAGSLFTFTVTGLPSPSGDLRAPLWLLVGMFALAEVLVVHVEFRGNAYSFSLSEIPFVIGLFTAEPVHLVGAHLLGSAAALVIHRRQSPLKLAFNLSHFALESCLALVVFNAFGAHVPLEPAAWVGTLLAILTAAAVADIAVETAVSLAEGGLEVEGMLQRMSFGKVLSATNASVGLIGALILWVQPSAIWVLLVPTAILFFSYRGYTAQREQHSRMEFLYESTHLLNRSLKIEAALPSLLSQARTMFRAEIAEILLFGAEKESPTRTRIGRGVPKEVLVPIDLDPTEGVWARVAAEGEALLFTRPIQPGQLGTHFAEQGIRDAMVAPLRGTEGVAGTIMVANRLGDVATFDANDLQMFEALANHASVSLENARLVQRLEESLIHMTEMNRMKDDFVATVSHELRTPLTSIQGSVKTLLQPGIEFDETDRKTLLEVVDRQGERLRQLIEDLLVAARIEAQPLRAMIAPVSLGAVVKQVVEGLGSRAASHRFVYDLAGDPGKVDTDERRVYQILSNLVDNSLKYSAPDTTITLRVRGAHKSTEVIVEDEGHGIPADQQEQIFDRFYQVDQTSTRAVGGTGLGLYICRRFAEVIGAEITLERSDEHGSVFKLKIPLTPPPESIRADDVPLDETLDLIASLKR